MRIPKYQAWHKAEKRMFTVYFLSWVGGVFLIGDKDAETSQRYGAGEVELREYTGLKDIHGKEIFEGDIVHNVTYTFNGIVFFENGSFWVRECVSHVDEGLYNDREKEIRWSIHLDWEIIGNMYENEEFLPKDEVQK